MTDDNAQWELLEEAAVRQGYVPMPCPAPDLNGSPAHVPTPMTAVSPRGGGIALHKCAKCGMLIEVVTTR